MSEVKNKKKKSSIIQVSIGVLAVIREMFLRFFRHKIAAFLLNYEK